MFKKFSFFNRAFLKNAFLLILSPKLFFNQGHIPPKNHKIPNHFFGLSLTIEDLIEDPMGVVEMCRQHKCEMSHSLFHPIASVNLVLLLWMISLGMTLNLISN